MSEQLLSVRLEQSVLRLRDIERQLRHAIADVLSLQHAVMVIEYTSGDRRSGSKVGSLPPNGSADSRLAR